MCLTKAPTGTLNYRDTGKLETCILFPQINRKAGSLGF